ncbi:BgTH12-01904, partial [Blumeria graminis f. sp. triticale]
WLRYFGLLLFRLTRCCKTPQTTTACLLSSPGDKTRPADDPMLDQFSPTAPAKVRVVLLPIGQIKRSRFLSFVKRLQPEHTVYLADVSPNGQPNKNMFSPLAFQNGIIVYDLMNFHPSDLRTILSPFELYREPLVIISLADGAGLCETRNNESEQGGFHEKENLQVHNVMQELKQDLMNIKERYVKALVHQILIFDYVSNNSASHLPEDIVAVPPPEKCNRTTMKTIMCDVSSKLLANMTDLAKSIQELTTLDFSSSSFSNQDSNQAIILSTKVKASTRRNSELTATEKTSTSPTRIADRNQSRMSMPVGTLDSKISSKLAGQTKPPTKRTSSDLSTTSERLKSMLSGDTQKSYRASSSRLFSPDEASEKSTDPGIQSERSKSKEKGRKRIAIGSLYMQAGRWSDALKELVEGATIAKNILDHLWHAKALDHIMVSLIMLAWRGLDFQIPQICYNSGEKLFSSSSHDESNSASRRAGRLRSLALLFPDLTDRILNLYNRASTNTGESLPQFSYSESVIRFSKILTAIYLNGGLLNNDILQQAVLGTPSGTTLNVMTPRLNIRPARSEIATLLFRAFPTASSDNFSVVDRSIILSGIAAVLSSLGYRRKKALVIRELVSYLIHGLIQVRIKGAAEMGVHPAASLAALSSIQRKNSTEGFLDLNGDDLEVGVDAFLGLLGQSYGVVSFLASYEPNGQIDDSNEAIISRILQNSSVRSYGNYKMKMDVLRSCLNISEALPDFRGILKFTADLLRTAGSGVAPGPRCRDASPSISCEEQIRLATNISRTLTSARNLGIDNLEAEYWDEFLLRGVEVEALPKSRLPISHTPSELPGGTTDVTSQEINPFIYNPFLRIPDSAAVDCLLIAGETATFKITLQNPFEFEVEIESLRLQSYGIECDSSSQKMVIGPYRTQILSITGRAKEPGQLKIVGCFIKIHGCRERRFPIFEDPWSPQREVKIRTIGISSLFKSKETNSISTSQSSLDNFSNVIPPKPKIVSLNVINKQPVVIVKHTTLTQSAIMVLEGEQQVFSITLQNISVDTPVNLLLFSFKDSTQEPLQAILNNRNSEVTELYECELILTRKQSLRWKRTDDAMPFIAPGAMATFEIEVYGKPGLTSAIVQIDYAFLDAPVVEIQEKFYTRQVSVPLSVTVNSSIELVGVDVIPFSSSIPRSLYANFGLQQKGESSFKSEDYFLLLLDFKNTWSNQLTVCIEIANQGSIEEQILTGKTSRIMIPVRRMFVDHISAPIPSLNPSRQRQFVVGIGNSWAGSERAKRKAFWYREELLTSINGTWFSKSSPHRNGVIDLRSMKLTTRMIEAIKFDDLDIHLSIGSNLQDSKVELSTGNFSELKIQIINKTPQSISSILRLQPSMRNQAQHYPQEISKRFVVNGLLQQCIPKIPGGGSIELRVGFIILAQGEYEINAVLEETRLQESEDQTVSSKSNIESQDRASEIINVGLGTKERQIWHLRKPLFILVRDQNAADDE